MKRIVLLMAIIVHTLLGMAQTLREGMTFEYEVIDASSSTTIYQTFALEKEVTINGKTYLPFVNQDTGETFFLRQDDRKCFVLITEDFLQKFEIPWDLNDIPSLSLPEVNEEILIWDFSAQVAEVYPFCGMVSWYPISDINPKYAVCTMEVVSQEIIEVNGRPYSKQGLKLTHLDFSYFPSLQIVEGIGGLQGYLFGPWQNEFALDCGHEGWINLQKVCNPEGEVIFTNRDFNGNAGIDSVDTDDMNNQIFDLSGKRIDKPQPGQIYIRNGKRLIAR